MPAHHKAQAWPCLGFNRYTPLMLFFRLPTAERAKFFFRALRSRNYRLFFLGQLTSLAGTWMSLMAMGWLVYRLTNDPFMLGLLGFCMHVPTFILSPLGGALVDRWNRRTVMIVAQSVDMLTMLTLATLTLTGNVEVWHILLGCSALGIAKAFDLPARQSLVVEIIEHRDDLPNAIALNSSMFHGARMLGPVLGGVIIWLAPVNGEGFCFLLDGLSYIAVIGALFALRLTARREPETRKHLLHDMREGFAHAFGFAPMRALMILMGTIALVGIPYGTLLPAIARDVLHGTERTYSLLVAAGGMGAFVGAMYLAGRSSVLGLGRIIAICTIMFGLSLALFSFSTHLAFSLPLLVIAGAVSMVAMAGTNTIIQTLVDDAMRGRVMSFFGMTFMGAMPMGALMAGKLATIIGPTTTIMIGGFASALAGVAFGWQLPALREIVRPIYVERGILPPMTETN
ncbi:MFS transporter [Phycisphaerales bacterium AB-hyl4]|uniref:MFS transporter n=1 Tax=Natronomicrosphaera hydrolytica TaxID=3242702 RepID=A0ABV4TZP8_9BACT